MKKLHAGLSDPEKSVYASFIFAQLANLVSVKTKDIKNTPVPVAEEEDALSLLYNLVRKAYYRAKNLTNPNILPFGRYPATRVIVKSSEPKIIVGSWLNDLISNLDNSAVPRSPGQIAAIQKLEIIGNKLKRFDAPKN